ncbi:MAG: ABC transporter permease [Gemmataceae bacterium]
MGLLSAIRIALAALLINKGRSTLTSLGIVIGISAVIAMVSAGDGAQRKLESHLDDFGKNLILVRAGGRTQQGVIADFEPLAQADADAIRKQASSLVSGVAESQFTHRLISTRQRHWGTLIVGTTPEIVGIRKWTVRHGRFFNDNHMRNQSAVCVLGDTVRWKLFPDPSEDPVGQAILIDRLPVRIIGVVEPKGRVLTGADQDDQVFMPLTTLQRKLVGEEKIGMIIISARSEDDIEQAKDKIDRVLRQRHQLKPGATPNYDISSVQEMSQLAVYLANVMQMLTAIIASISLLVGGIGIMNIMLASVTERTREIGIRMAVGATGMDVLIQFLIEAVVLALIGGLLGITLGILAAYGLAVLADWPLVFSPAVMFLALAVPVGIGIFFGYYPALKASRLDPIEALRYE